MSSDRETAQMIIVILLLAGCALLMWNEKRSKLMIDLVGCMFLLAGIVRGLYMWLVLNQW